jgi:hypothetical protein
MKIQFIKTMIMGSFACITFLDASIRPLAIPSSSGLLKGMWNPRTAGKNFQERLGKMPELHRAVYHTIHTQKSTDRAWLCSLLENPETNVDALNDRDETALYLAVGLAKNDDISMEVIDKLLNHSAKVDAPTKYWRTALFQAIRPELDIAYFKKLVDAGAAIGVQDKSGMTPLHRAVEQKRPDIVLLLVRSNVDAEVQNHAHRTPLDLVPSEDFPGKRKMVRILRKAMGLVVEKSQSCPIFASLSG